MYLLTFSVAARRNGGYENIILKHANERLTMEYRWAEYYIIICACAFQRKLFFAIIFFSTFFILSFFFVFLISALAHCHREINIRCVCCFHLFMRFSKFFFHFCSMNMIIVVLCTMICPLIQYIFQYLLSGLVIMTIYLFIK